ncbi:MAG: nucleotidyl transferase AbiEii/AbiGii toxin family protein [Deltaproteobacteria bacterium]|nr:nucleotidyl transferase AbiEii/AbiGii toxin family protein [Deltaproteobacteria bacterium]
MDKIHFLPSQERLRYFTDAANQMGLVVPMIEKDYWVVWVLGQMFDLDELKDHLTFKGGTSLSKVYGLIKRFSEDVDLSIEKSFFGFADEKSPEQAKSRKQRTLTLEKLSTACSQYIQNHLLKTLKEKFSKELSSSEKWDLVVDETEVVVQVLNVERTFWEKATILHQYAHLPADKKLLLRLSRHYYDFHCLLQAPTKHKALAAQDLLGKVAHHKELYFPSAWAKYSLAKKGSLTLVPPDPILKELEKDYEQMGQMFFEDPTPWGEVMASIRLFEEEFNF